MPTKEEIEKVITWCDDIRAKKGRPAIERNPFTREMRWMEKFALIYIDMRKETVPKTCLVYDSEARQLWQYISNGWVTVFADLTSK